MISKALNGPYINHDEFVSVNNMLRKYNQMKEDIENLENTVGYIIQKQRKHIMSAVRKIRRTKTLVSEKVNKID